MTTAIQKSPAICPALDNVEKEFVTAMLTVPIPKMGQDELFRGILQTVNRSYLELGQMPAGTTTAERDKSLAAITNLIIIDIKEYFPRLTLDEFNLAVRRGLRFEYGKYYGFNVLSVHKFIESFLACEEREMALSKQQRYLQEAKDRETEPLSVEQKWEIMKHGILSQFEAYKSTKVIRDYGNASYDFFAKAGVIQLSNEEKKLIFKEAEEMVKTEALTKSGSDLFMTLVGKKFNSHDKKAAAVSMAKQISLAKFYDSDPDIPGLLKSEKLFKAFCDE